MIRLVMASLQWVSHSFRSRRIDGGSSLAPQTSGTRSVEEGGLGGVLLQLFRLPHPSLFSFHC